MARKQDPVHAVIAYFDEAPLELAQQALAIVTRMVRQRTPFKATKKRPAPSKPGAAPAATTAPVAAPVATSAPASTSRPKPSRLRRKTATVPPPPTPQASEADLALPGLGPATVGE